MYAYNIEYACVLLCFFFSINFSFLSFLCFALSYPPKIFLFAIEYLLQTNFFFGINPSIYSGATTTSFATTDYPFQCLTLVVPIILSTDSFLLSQKQNRLSQCVLLPVVKLDMEPHHL